MFHKAKIHPQSGGFCLKWFDIYYLEEKEKGGECETHTHTEVISKSRWDKRGWRLTGNGESERLVRCMGEREKLLGHIDLDTTHTRHLSHTKRHLGHV